jgi:hypothetical protein
MKGATSVICEIATGGGAATEANQRGVDGVGAVKNDNYGGGDDNYAVVMGTNDVEDGGWDRQE